MLSWGDKKTPLAYYHQRSYKKRISNEPPIQPKMCYQQPKQ